MQIVTDAFEADGPIPDRYTRAGEDRSPPLSWSQVPDRTAALALVVDDPDSPSGKFTHWLLWNIPVSSEGLEENVEHRGRFVDGKRQGDNDFGERGWSGPRPPTGDEHRYVFRLYALDEPLTLIEGAMRPDLDAAMRGHVLAEASRTCRYGG
ncbi:MAG: YbhB/YbcL family Raf kinase inhibitor-like protein [Sandaracinaceae bacterium]